jgi:DNA (cytosine-5)-methyltransferase 1
MTAPPPEHRINLRLRAEVFEEIEKLRHEGNGKLSYNAWVERAIEEKIQRDRVRETALPQPGEGQRTFYEFFAGGGMARLGLGPNWFCLFANDIDLDKARAYRENWEGGAELVVEDVAKLTPGNLPGTADLAWASFPCQDLSVAGNNAGLVDGSDAALTRSGTFWKFWRLLNRLASEERKPKVVVLENVCGVLTSNEGRDFAAIGAAFVRAGYKFGAVVIDAKLFVPQSRPRVFIVGVQQQMFVAPALVTEEPDERWHTGAMKAAYGQLAEDVRRQWIWWTLPTPPARTTRFADLIEESPQGVDWHSDAETKRLLSLMSPRNRKKVEQAQKSGKLHVGGVYRRTRKVEGKRKRVQRAEVRFDDIAGCLRTPSGGSSRQLILVVHKNKVRSRLLSPREAARLMGLPDTYCLPRNYNDAYYLCGDGVVAPAVRFVAEHLLEPLVDNNRAQVLLPLRAA